MLSLTIFTSVSLNQSGSWSPVWEAKELTRLPPGVSFSATTLCHSVRKDLGTDAPLKILGSK